MKNIFSLLLLASFVLIHNVSCAQNEDKSKRASPAATVTQNINGATVTINYSQPALKGRIMGKDVEPMEGKIWRAGANEATVFETTKDIKIEGETLPAGKYALFAIKEGDDWTLIFNKQWKTWGAFDYEKNKGDDALKVKVKSKKSNDFHERLTYTIENNGKTSLLWGDAEISFKIK